jgi:hypothetical protein
MNPKLLNRKFETREESKRETIDYENIRKYTPASKSLKNDLLDLFPATFDQITTEIIVSSLKNNNLKLSPRKEHFSKYRENQQIVDP